MANSKVVLSIGSNCSDVQVADASEWLGMLLSGVRVSARYSTKPIQGFGDPYVNAVVTGETPMSFEDLNGKLKEYEILHGRNEGARQSGLVPVDIDIVIWNNEVVRPRDFKQSFFQIGYSELTGAVVEAEADC